MPADERIIGVYPGTFDPITNGHFDIIQRAATRLTDRLIVAVAEGGGKAALFDIDERLEMVRDEVAPLNQGGERVVVRPFDILLMDFVQQSGARFIVRGLRAVSDFEYEFQMAGMNARLNPEIETVFLMASDRHQFISSRFVKEIGRLGGDIRHFVSPAVARRLFERVGRPPADAPPGKVRSLKKA